MNPILSSVLLFLTLYSSPCSGDGNMAAEGIMPIEGCNLNPDLVKEIQSYQPVVSKIINHVCFGPRKGKGFALLKEFVTNYYHRPSGSEMNAQGLDFLLKYMKKHALVTSSQEVPVPKWVRGEESAELLEPRKWKLSIIALGNSVATPDKGLTAEAVVYRSLDELKANPGPAKGKIVVMYNEWRNYDYARMHRGDTATEAAKAGGIAAIVRSATPYSLNNPHTGAQNYVDGVEKIPVVAASVEDVEMLDRLYNNGTGKLKIKLSLIGHQTHPDTTSRNVFGKLLGSESPNQRVILSGHTDGWDVGEGAHDDGAGVASAIEAVIVLKSLGLKPKRTVEAVGWASEEVGYHGIDGYIKERGDELKDIVAGFEADWGFFRPLGFDIAQSDEGACIAKEIISLFAPINATLVRRFKSVSSDISHLLAKGGVPGFSMNTQDERYFWYHHTFADTLNAVDPEDLNIGVAMYAAAAYILADLSIVLPRAPIPDNVH